MPRKPLLRVALATLLFAALLGCSSTPKPAATGYAAMPPNKDNDLKLYYADGRIVSGAPALARMQEDAEVILWLAGNQFFAMDDVVHAFQAQQPATDVGLITLPISWQHADGRVRGVWG